MKDFTYVFLTLLLLLSLAPAASANLPGPEQDPPSALTWAELLDQLRTRDSLVYDDLLETFYQAIETDENARENVAAGLRALEQVADSLNAPLQQAHLNLVRGNYISYFSDGEATLPEEMRLYRLAEKVYAEQGRTGYLSDARQLIILTYIDIPDSINLAEPLLLEMIRNESPESGSANMGLWYSQLVMIHYTLDDHDQALEYALKSNELIGDTDPHDVARNVTYIVSIEYERGNYAEAIAAVDELERRFGQNNDPALRFDYADAYRDRGRSHYALGDKAAALADFKRSIEEVERLSNGTGDEREAYYELGPTTLRRARMNGQSLT